MEKNPPPEPLPAEWDFSATHSPLDGPHLAVQYREMLRQQTDASPPGHSVTLPDVAAAELRRMHHNIVVEDRAALDGADPATAWLYHHEHAEELEAAPRGGFFIYLGRESIKRLARVPDDEALAAMTRDEQVALAWESWVKVVDMSGHVDSDDSSDTPVETGISDDAWRRRRLRLANLSEFLIESAERYIDEMTYEGHGYERNPGNFERTFSPKDHLQFPGKEDRLEALYGPQVALRYWHTKGQQPS